MHRPPKHTRGSSNEDSDPSKLSITNEMLVLTVLYTALSLIVSPTAVVIDASSHACINPTIFKLSHKSNTTTRYLYHPLSIFFFNFTLKNSGNFIFVSSTNFLSHQTAADTSGQDVMFFDSFRVCQLKERCYLLLLHIFPSVCCMYKN